MSFVHLLDRILEEMKQSGELLPGLNPQGVRSALMGMVEGMLRDRFLAERLAYPADFDMHQVALMLERLLAACVTHAAAEASSG